uniref:Uncharacterized protein n=1 Tax=viral metagenome TaxID=1070528 RepID=A0A6M3KXS7_9ZZZZ
MPLKGDTKKNYQRDYMKKKRSNKVVLDPPPRIDDVLKQGLTNMNKGGLSPVRPDIPLEGDKRIKFIQGELGEDLSNRIDRVHQYMVGIGNTATTRAVRYDRAYRYHVSRTDN